MTTAPAESRTHPLVTAIIPSIRIAQGLFHSLLDGVSPDRFARQPEGINASHPAFILGHLSLYPPQMLAGLGVDDLEPMDESRRPLFEAGAECRDDPDGSIYPPMDEIVAEFDRVMSGAVERLPRVDPERFEQAPPPERSFDGLMPTMGAATNFILVAHPMMHAGQISTWRRAMGLPPCKLG